MNEINQVERMFLLPPGTLLQQRLAKLSADADALAQQLGRRPAGAVRDEAAAKMEHLLALRPGTLTASRGATALGGATSVAQPGASTPSTRIHLLPGRDFPSLASGPGLGNMWRIDDTSGPAVAARLSARPIEIGLDQVSRARRVNGAAGVPAAGWLTSATWIPGAGLFGEAEWTLRASEMIANLEYRYLKCLIRGDAAGRVTEVAAVTLANFPDIPGLQPLTVPASQASTAVR